MKLTIKNFQVAGVLNLIDELYPQRMLIGEKLKLRENSENLIKKQNTINELRKEIVLANGGTVEAGLPEGHENIDNAIKEITELLNLETEISIQPIPMNILERFESSAGLDIVEIIAGAYKLPEVL